MCLPRTADVDETGVPEFVVENIDHQFEHVIVQRPEGAVDQHPGRRLQQNAGEGQAQLFVLAQFPIPALRGVEQRREAFEAQPEQGARECALAETLSLQGIGQDLAQGSARQVRGAAGQIEDLLAPRADDAAASPGPQPRERAEQLCFSRARSAQYQGALAGGERDLGLLEPVGVGGGHYFEIVDLHRTRIALRVSDAAADIQRLLRGHQGAAKLATRSRVARQSAMALKLSMNQRSDDCAWVNAPAAIMSPPNDTFPVK